jgi:hypothetical protein
VDGKPTADRYFFATLSVNARLAVWAGVWLSLTPTVKLKLATFVGVPEIVPVEELSDSPGGRAPAAIRHV